MELAEEIRLLERKVELLRELAALELQMARPPVSYPVYIPLPAPAPTYPTYPWWWQPGNTAQPPNPWPLITISGDSVTLSNHDGPATGTITNQWDPKNISWTGGN